MNYKIAIFAASETNWQTVIFRVNLIVKIVQINSLLDW